MTTEKILFTSESVTEGHPDKISDQISDAILDAIMAEDPKCRVACETLVTTGMAMLAGEITTDCYVDMPTVVRATIRDIGYQSSHMGFDFETCAVLTSIDQQTADIAMGVNEGEGMFLEQGAGDQGLMFGYATDETPEFMPMPISYAHKICQRLAEVRKNGSMDYLRPDGKAQVTIEYVDGVPKRVDTIVVASQHKPDVEYDTLRADIVQNVVKKVIPEQFLDGDTKYYINATGRFVVGGPMGDCGLTGRKIIVDTYGGMGRHGGGAFSGKDPSKVDRSACYMARHVAKNIVAAGIAKKCEVQVAYAIGVAKPVSVNIDLMGTGNISHEKAQKIVLDTFDFRPKAIVDYLDLLRPIYRKTAAYGHFGRNEPEFTWEKTNMADTLRQKAGL